MDNIPSVRRPAMDQFWRWDYSGLVVDEYDFTVCQCGPDWWNIARDIVHEHNILLKLKRGADAS